MEKTLNKIVGVTELQRNSRAVFDEVVRKHVPYVLTRGSRPEAALIPCAQFLKLVETEQKGVLARFDRVLARMAAASARFSDAEVQGDLRPTPRSRRRRK
jgi:prevent-host-death family protein